MLAFLYSFSSSWTEVISAVEGLGILGGIVAWYRSTRCHNTDCRNRLGLKRFARYPHGHYRLCHVHHPHVPSDGIVTQEHVDEMTARKANEASVPTDAQQASSEPR